MARIQSKLLAFALEKFDGYVLIDNINNCLPSISLTELHHKNTLTLAKKLFSEITGISSNWPSLRFSLAFIDEQPISQYDCYIISVIYSIYLENKVKIVEDYKWKKISSLTPDFIDYNIVIEGGKKRYV
jgi:hypothetical protein